MLGLFFTNIQGLLYSQTYKNVRISSSFHTTIPSCYLAVIIVTNSGKRKRRLLTKTNLNALSLKIKVFSLFKLKHIVGMKHNLNIRIIKVSVLQCDEPRKINTKSFLKWDVIIYNKIQIIHMNQFTYDYKFLLHVQVSKLGIQYTSTMLKTLMVNGGLLSMPVNVIF